MLISYFLLVGVPKKIRQIIRQNTFFAKSDIIAINAAAQEWLSGNPAAAARVRASVRVGKAESEEEAAAYYMEYLATRPDSFLARDLDALRRRQEAARAPTLLRRWAALLRAMWRRMLDALRDITGRRLYAADKSAQRAYAAWRRNAGDTRIPLARTAQMAPAADAGDAGGVEIVKTPEGYAVPALQIRAVTPRSPLYQMLRRRAEGGGRLAADSTLARRLLRAMGRDVVK